MLHALVTKRNGGSGDENDLEMVRTWVRERNKLAGIMGTKEEDKRGELEDSEDVRGGTEPKV